MKRIISCDPGVGGGFCVVDVGPPELLTLISMPDSLVEIASMLRGLKVSVTELWIEEVPKFCGKFRNESTTAVLFQNFGRVEGCAATLGMSVHRVPPKVWQGVLGIGTRGTLDSIAWKRKLRVRAAELFPHVEGLTLKTADALLIAHFALGGGR